MTIPPVTSSLSLGALRVSGADARAFLQGQLSTDLDALTPARALLSSCNSAQGRVQAVLWLVERGDGIALVLPASMAERTAARLRKYVLRSKVKIDELPDAVDLPASHAYREPDWRSRESAPACRRCIRRRTKRSSRRCSTWICWAASTSRRAATPGRKSSRARTFAARSSGACSASNAQRPPPEPGARIVAGDQHAGEVVDAAATNAGCELLAVINLAQQDAVLELESNRGVQLRSSRCLIR